MSMFKETEAEIREYGVEAWLAVATRVYARSVGDAYAEKRFKKGDDATHTEAFLRARDAADSFLTSMAASKGPTRWDAQVDYLVRSQLQTYKDLVASTKQ